MSTQGSKGLQAFSVFPVNSYAETSTNLSTKLPNAQCLVKTEHWIHGSVLFKVAVISFKRKKASRYHVVSISNKDVSLKNTTLNWETSWPNFESGSLLGRMEFICRCVVLRILLTFTYHQLVTKRRQKRLTGRITSIINWPYICRWVKHFVKMQIIIAGLCDRTWIHLWIHLLQTTYSHFVYIFILWSTAVISSHLWSCSVDTVLMVGVILTMAGSDNKVKSWLGLFEIL